MQKKKTTITGPQPTSNQTTYQPTWVQTLRSQLMATLPETNVTSPPKIGRFTQIGKDRIPTITFSGAFAVSLREGNWLLGLFGGLNSWDPMKKIIT